MFEFLKNLFYPSNEEVSALGLPRFGSYLLNDPSTPDLKIPTDIPEMKSLKYNVRGYTPRVRTPQDERAAICQITVGNTINYVQQHTPTIQRWATQSVLQVLPEAGRDLNAYYDRKALKFFFGVDPVLKKQVYSSSSADIVAHELGHALLDAIRPDFWSVQALEIWAFHEAFGDIIAIASCLQHERMMDHVLKETGGNLRLSNTASKLAEEFGRTVYNVTKGAGGHSSEYLRNAVNSFNYNDPAGLPKDGPDNVLSSECHSFARVFVAAWYDFMVGLYEHYVSEGKSQMVSLAAARDMALSLFLYAIPRVPRVPKFYEACATTIITLAKTKGDYCENIARTAFENRKIIRQQIKMLSSVSWDDFKQTLKAEDEVLWQDGIILARVNNPKVIKLANYIPEGMVSSMSAGGFDLAEVDMEIACDSYYQFDSNGNLTDQITVDEQEAVDNARYCALVIQQQDSLGPDDKTMWEVQEGKLFRSHVVCGCHGI